MGLLRSAMIVMLQHLSIARAPVPEPKQAVSLLERMEFGSAFHKRGEYTYMKYWIFVALFVLGATISYAQYNVAPPTTCLNTNANWDGTNWTCTTSADTINTTSTVSTQTAKQTLLSRTLPAGYLAINGQCINIIAWGTAKANNNTKTQTIDFGATTIATTGA